MFRFTLLLTTIFLISFFSCVQKAPQIEAPKTIYTTKKIADISFSKVGDKNLTLDLYLPENCPVEVPIVVWIHGGGWRSGDKNSPEGLWLVQHGFAIASISYRLSNEAIWPAQINDCRAAIRYLRENAKTYGLKGDKIAVWGSSAGGLLASLLGTSDEVLNEEISSKVQAVINWFGPTDLLTLPENIVGGKYTNEMVAKSNASRLLGKDIREAQELAQKISPLYNVSKDDAPFIIVQGELDQYVIPEQNIQLHRKQKEVGADSELILVKDAGHAHKFFHTEEINQKMLTFLNKTLYDK